MKNDPFLKIICVAVSSALILSAAACARAETPVVPAGENTFAGNRSRRLGDKEYKNYND